jgi:tetratricopeptide (TPR) repeat protein
MYKIILLISILLSATLMNLLAQSKLEKHFYKGEYAEVITLFNQQVDEGKADISDYQLAAKCYVQQFDFASAVNCYRQVLSLDSLNPQALEGLADASIEVGLKKEALDIYESLLNGDSTNTRIAGKYAALLMDVDAFKHAEEVYNRLVGADTSNLYFARKLIVSIYKQEDFPRIVPLTLNYLAKQPADLEMRLVLITSYQRIDSTILAVDELYKLLAIDSLNIIAISKLAFIYFTKLKEYDEAVIYYRQLNAMEQNSDLTHLTNQGICEFFIGNVEYSAHLLDSLSTLLPTDAMIPFYAGLSYKGLGNTDMALQFLELSAFLAVPAYLADVYHHLGRTYRDKRMFTEALAVFSKVRETNPQNYMVLFDIALTHEEYNLNRKEAFNYYTQFVEESGNPDSPETKYAQSRIDKIKEILFFEGK